MRKISYWLILSRLVIVKYEEKSYILLLKATKNLIIAEYKEKSQILQITITGRSQR